MLVAGGVLVTIGGYLAKDGWEEMKKSSLSAKGEGSSDSNGLPNADNQMHITIDPEKLFIVVKHDLERLDQYRNESTTSESVLLYIDSIAREAEAFASIWAEIADDLERKNVSRDKLSMDELEHKYGFKNEPNAPYFYRLLNFYRFLPEVVEHSVNPEWIESLTYSLNSMVIERDKLLGLFSGFSSDSTAAAFFSKSNTKDDLRTLRSSVILLQREASAIEALSQALRASIDTKAIKQSSR